MSASAPPSVAPAPGSAAAPPLLEITDLEIAYHSGAARVRAVRKASLRVEQGEVVGIVGESGCGKSTLAATIAGMQSPAARITAGSMRFAGEALDPPRQRRARGDDIAMIFQDPMSTFNPVLSIGAQLVDFQHRTGRSRRERRERAIAMLGRVGIAEAAARFHAYPHELSGGMRQRAAIAAALLVDPRLLIADEPTTALDVTTEAQIVHLFAELRRDYGGAILIVTHHLGVVAQLCDRVVVMYAGEVVEEGTAEEVFLAPAHPYTRALLACDPALIETRSRRLPMIPGQLPDPLDPPRGCAFAARCPEREEACVTAGATLAESARRRVLCRHADRRAFA